MLALHSVTRSAGSRRLVDGVSFSMAVGEVVALLGPSGSGKTTLLRLVAGFDAPASGEIMLHGRRVSAPGRVLLPPEQREVALAFQDATLFPHLDALDNAAFGVRGGTSAARRERARAALSGMGLADVERRNVATLSGGEAQRVALARALAADAKLLLLDEPFGNVDRMTRSDLVERLRGQLAGGQGALLITHDPRDALDLGARVLLLREGRLVADASVDAIVDGAHGEWAAGFLRAGLR